MHGQKPPAHMVVWMLQGDSCVQLPSLQHQSLLQQCGGKRMGQCNPTGWKTTETATPPAPAFDVLLVCLNFDRKAFQQNSSNAKLLQSKTGRALDIFRVTKISFSALTSLAL